MAIKSIQCIKVIAANRSRLCEQQGHTTSYSARAQNASSPMSRGSNWLFLGLGLIKGHRFAVLAKVLAADELQFHQSGNGVGHFVTSDLILA